MVINGRNCGPVYNMHPLYLEAHFREKSACYIRSFTVMHLLHGTEASKFKLHFPPHLFSVHTLPWETSGTCNHKVSHKGTYF